MTITARRTKKPTATVPVFSAALQAGYKTATEALAPPVAEEPEVDLFVVAAALEAYYLANESGKETARTMRRSKKIIVTLKAGAYGGWKLAWKPSTRQTPDLAAIEETYRRLNLGPVPMKDCADSIEVTPA